MSIPPRHVPFGEWIDSRYQELASLSLKAGVSLEQAADGARLVAHINLSLMPPSAQVIQFPGRRDA